MGNKVKGFSLVELMVAMTLLSLFIFIGSMSYSTYISSYAKVKDRISDNLRIARNHLLIQKAISSTVTHSYRKSESEIALNFVGLENSFSSTTSSSVFYLDEPAIYTLSFEQVDDGSYQLAYSESKYLASPELLVNEPQSLRQLVVLNGITNFSIAYYGWGHYKDKFAEAGDNVQQRSWRSTYNANESQILPSKVSIKYSLANDVSNVLYFNVLDASEKIVTRSANTDNDA